MKLSLFTLFLCLGLPFWLSAQALERRSTVHDNIESIGIGKKITLSYDFKQGEEIIINLQPLNGRLNRFSVNLEGSPFKYVAKRVRRVERERIIVPKDGTYFFELRNRRVSGLQVNVRIEKDRRMRARDTLYMSDLIFTAKTDTVMVPFIDTIPVPDISTISFTLNQSLYVNGMIDTCIVEELLQDSFQYASYWIGLGDEALIEYEKLKATPPPNWLLETVNEPIIAFGLGLTQKLPLSSSALAANLRFEFQDPMRPDVRLTQTSPQRFLYFDHIPRENAFRHKRMKVCIRNFNTSTGVPVHIKVAKFQIKKGFRPQVVIRERIQEVYTKDRVDGVEPEE